jgi:hypothetical protein
MATQTQNEQVDAAEVWRAIGRIEGDTTAIRDGQDELRDTQRDIREEIREVRTWMIRLFYVIISASPSAWAAR